MKQLTLIVALTLAPLAWAQDPPGEAKKPAATAPAATPALDVSKMPFTAESIRQVVNSNLDKINGCYEELLAGLPPGKAVDGKIMTSFVITGEGLVKGAKVLKKGTTIRDPKLHDCVVAVLTAMTFPKPNTNRDHPIEYPFNLKAIR